MSGLGELRHEPTAKRIRAQLGEATVVDSTRAALVWEPRRVVPRYAVPVEDVRAELTPAGRSAGGHRGGWVFHSRAVLASRARPVDSVRRAHRRRRGRRRTGNWADPRGRRVPPSDPALNGYVVLDFDAFDTWYEEDEVNLGHPRDPFHRIDILASSRHIRLELDGVLLGDSSRPMLLFDTMLATRYYLPREDVRAELIPSPTRTVCAYKGQASYLSPTVGDQPVPDLAWTYPDPQREASEVRGLVSCFDERVDVVLDRTRVERPMTPWSAGPGR